ncbi:Fic family protein [Psychrobacter sp. P11G5]|uniref:Fic family protein n=1 Tax=Psychrobacter sp. P11G5 TaxID=1699624 RepID=UPI00078DBD40|nr:Fic family protein [Psychrobacter sp. P11G5]AMN67281.1 cell filamentation protein Fic [Psychrobacter sp. P11G5]
MYKNIVEPVGGLWLIRYADVKPVAPLYVVSSIGGRRETIKEDDFRHNIYQDTMRPDDTLIAHLQFHLRHEVVHFELLYRVFQKVGGSDIQAWVNTEPTGQYARRCAFLYEWLTNDKLMVPKNIGGNYANALDAKKLVTSDPAQIIKNTRWRINDNVAGTPDLCPMLVKTDKFNHAIDINISDMLNELNREFGEDLLMRASVWMTLRESRASFAIEGEGQAVKRIERFADVMARRTGQDEIPLTAESLAELQQQILGDKSIIEHYGVRQSPVFVGQTEIRGLKEVVHYIAPPADDVIPKLDGLMAFMTKTGAQSSVMRSAVASFAFIYIHPLADGNGRVHRFLINDILRRDGVMSEPIILPISQAIAEHASDRHAYDNILDNLSKPLMQALRGHYSFNENPIRYLDGIYSNLNFTATEMAQPVWRFMDLTPHVQYLSKIIHHVIVHDMHQESSYLKQHDHARSQIKEVIEMPNDYADRIIRSVLNNKGDKSNKLLKEFTFLADDDVWQQIRDIVVTTFVDEINS